LNKTVQCDLHHFCVTGDLRIPLQAATQRYTADVEGTVLFGWAEEGTGAELDQTGGPNDGTWILPDAEYEEPTGPVGARMSLSVLPMALECTMGVDCKDPVLGVDCAEPLSSPTPDEALISFPIQREVP